nr:hypothetical protein [uncultured Cohaesibacter sp.]
MIWYQNGLVGFGEQLPPVLSISGAKSIVVFTPSKQSYNAQMHIMFLFKAKIFLMFFRNNFQAWCIGWVSDEQRTTDVITGYLKGESVMATAANKTNSTKEVDLGKEIEQLRSDIEGITELLSKRGTEEVINLQDRARGAAQVAVEKAQEKLTDINQDFGRAEAQLMLEIRKKPLAAIGVAAGVGFLAALLVRK